MKPIFAAVLLSLPLVAQAGVTSETFCFSSGGTRSINFEMRTYYDASNNFSSGFVRYQNSKEPISLVLSRSTSEELDKGAPDQETTTWTEVFNGQITGEYEMITQGTGISSMVYANRKNNRKTGFLLNTSAITQDGCKW